MPVSSDHTWVNENVRIHIGPWMPPPAIMYPTTLSIRSNSQSASIVQSALTAMIVQKYTRPSIAAYNSGVGINPQPRTVAIKPYVSDASINE